MSHPPTEDHPEPGISDEELPEDLVPDDDNPLAKGLDDGETVGDLLEDGKHAEQSEDPESARDESDPSQPD